MAKLISISLLDEEISAERLMEALNKLSSRDLRKYFKRKKDNPNNFGLSFFFNKQKMSVACFFHINILYLS